MSAHDAAKRFADGPGRTIPPPPFRHERPAPEPRRRRVEEEIEPMYYPVEQSRAQGCAGFVLQALFYMVLLGVLAGFLFFGIRSIGLLSSGETSAAPLPTAGVPTRTALPPPRNPPQTFGGASAPAEQAPPAVEPTRAWPDDGGEDLQIAPARSDAPPPAEPAADNEAAIEAWLAAPPSTPTPLPEPGQPGFAASFEEAPACSPFVGYIGPDKARCAAVFLEQTATAGEEE